MKIYKNGDIITMNDNMPNAEVVIEDGGKIVFVGKAADAPVQLKEGAEVIDLQGKTLLPAFLDAHSHISDTAMLLKAANLQSAESFAELVSQIKAHLSTSANDEQRFIVGLGYDHNKLKEKKHPDKFLLDDAFPDVPVVIVHTSIHMCVVNSAMLSLLGIDANTSAPAGGIIGRIEGSEEPNGYLEETAFNPVYDLICKEMELTVEDLLRAEHLYMENGMLTIQEGSTDEKIVALCREAAEQNRLTCDLIAYPAVNFGRGIGNCFSDHAKCDRTYFNHFKIAGYKLLLDGSPQGKTAWLSEPYEGTSDCSYGWLTDEEVQAYTDQAFAEKRQVLAHCNGDAASEQFINACEQSLKKYPDPDPRPVMIHCQTVRRDQLDRMAAIGMIASVFVSHVYYWGDIHLKNLGPVRGHHISPMRSALDRQVSVNIHTDCPVVMPNLFHAMWTAVNRKTKNGIVLGSEERITVWEALKALTIDAAYAYYEEGQKGSLEVGKQADFIIIDKNPLSIDPDELKNLTVLACIQAGKYVYQKTQ